MNKKTVIRKTIGLGLSTFASRILGIVRELLYIQYLGVNAISDVFNVAFRIPNSLRKVLAEEGAMSASLVPAFVRSMRDGKKDEVNSLMLLAFIVFESFVLGISLLLMWQAEWVVRMLGPGFTAEQIEHAIPMFRVLMPFIFFLSSSAILSSALQSANHFFIPAISPALMNVVFVSSLVLCIVQDLPIYYLCYCIIGAGVLQLLVHIVAYVQLKFSFSRTTPQTWQIFRPIAINVLFCFICVGMTSEMNLIIDVRFASYLPSGSISLLSYATRFMGIPLGLFASALSTILLPHFSKVTSYAPRRLNFYMVETAKLVFWVTIPMMLIMGFLSEKLFSTLFLSSKFTTAHIVEARTILIAFLLGLFSLSFNKILLNMYYSRSILWLPALISVAGAGINWILNSLLIGRLQATGLALGTSLSAIIQTFLLLIFLRMWLGYSFYARKFMSFCISYCLQLAIILPLAYLAYVGLYKLLSKLPLSMACFLTEKIGFWLWVGPLCLVIATVVYMTRKAFGIRLFFFD